MANEEDGTKEKKKAGAFSWLWPKITNMDSAVEAAKGAQIAAYWMAFSYGIQLVFLTTTGSSLYGTAADDDIELYIFGAFYLAMALFFLWLGLRIRKSKFGSVPFVAIWLIFEVVIKAFMAPGKGVVLSIIFLFIAIGALRGWFGIRRYRTETAVEAA